MQRPCATLSSKPEQLWEASWIGQAPPGAAAGNVFVPMHTFHIAFSMSAVMCFRRVCWLQMVATWPAACGRWLLWASFDAFCALLILFAVSSSLLSCMFCLQAANARDLASSLWALATLGYTPQRSFLAAFGAQVIGDAQWGGRGGSPQATAYGEFSLG